MQVSPKYDYYPKPTGSHVNLKKLQKMKSELEKTIYDNLEQRLEVKNSNKNISNQR